MPGPAITVRRTTKPTRTNRCQATKKLIYMALRAIPCTFIGKHLRFSDDDIAQIMAEGARQPVTRGRGTRR